MLKAVGSIVAPTTLLTAVLFYFGWLHAYWFFHYFGVHSTLFDFSTRDYVQRSVDGLFVPVTVIACAALPVLWGHTRLRARLHAGARPPWLTEVVAVMVAAGAIFVGGALLSILAPQAYERTLAGLAGLPYVPWVLAAVGLLAVVAAAGLVHGGAIRPRALRSRRFFTLLRIGAATFAAGVVATSLVVLRFATPLHLAFGVGLLVYCEHLRRWRRPRLGVAAPPWVAVAEWAVVFALVGVSLFWAAADYSAAVGESRAAQLVRDLPQRPSAVLYSERSLGLTAPGVQEVRCGVDDAAYAVRYDGLKLILQSADQYFLLPQGWSRTNGVALVLPRTDSVRLEFLPSSAAASAAAADC